MQRFLFLVFFLAFNLQAFSQNSVNNYEYIIVPKTYEFLGKEDAYQLNSLTAFLFNKYGFKAFIQGNEMPKDLSDNNCKGLLVNVKRNPSLFVTKLVITLNDCRGNVVFTSSEGTSREKTFKTSYHEALRNAFKDVQRLNYKYVEVEDSSSEKKEVVSSPKKEEEITSKKDPIDTKVEATIPPKKEVSLVSKTLSYTLNENSYTFKKHEYGYEIFIKQEGNSISVGKIYKLKRENSYLIDAGDLSGGGHFDSYGNFILERINPATNKIIFDTFARQ